NGKFWGTGTKNGRSSPWSSKDIFNWSCPWTVKESSAQQLAPISISIPIPQSSAWAKRETSKTLPIQRWRSTVQETVEARTKRAIRVERNLWSACFIWVQNYKLWCLVPHLHQNI